MQYRVKDQFWSAYVAYIVQVMRDQKKCILSLRLSSVRFFEIYLNDNSAYEYPPFDPFI